MAHVHVVIIGLAFANRTRKRLFEYELGRDEPNETNPKRINAYLVDGPDILVDSHTKPLCNVPELVFGSMPNDGGNLLLNAEERTELLRECPAALRFIRKFTGADEFINRIDRWCLWLVDATPKQIRELTPIRKRVEAVKAHRLQSKRGTTIRLAQTPWLFGEIRQPISKYLLVPGVSSERRRFIPIAFNPPSIIASNATLVFPDARLFHFGVVSSTMHMAWVRTVCGRLKSDYRYSAKLVYNNFPWPPELTKKQGETVESAAQQVLDVRDEFPDSTLADLYGPLSMPAKLAKAHAALDKAVDRCYRSQPFPTERHRIEYLFELYQQLTKPLMAQPKKPRKRKVK